MSTQNLLGVSPISLKAGGTIVANRLVKVDTTADNQTVQSAAASDNHIGVALIGGSSGDQIPIQTHGKFKATASGSITRGDRLMWATGGKVATFSGANNRFVGIATKSAADGDLVEFIGDFPSPLMSA